MGASQAGPLGVGSLGLGASCSRSGSDSAAAAATSPPSHDSESTGGNARSRAASRPAESAHDPSSVGDGGGPAARGAADAASWRAYLTPVLRSPSESPSSSELTSSRGGRGGGAAPKFSYAALIRSWEAAAGNGGLDNGLTSAGLRNAAQRDWQAAVAGLSAAMGVRWTVATPAALPVPGKPRCEHSADVACGLLATDGGTRRWTPTNAAGGSARASAVASRTSAASGGRGAACTTGAGARSGSSSQEQGQQR